MATVKNISPLSRNVPALEPTKPLFAKTTLDLLISAGPDPFSRDPQCAEFEARMCPKNEDCLDLSFFGFPPPPFLENRKLRFFDHFWSENFQKLHVENS